MKFLHRFLFHIFLLIISFGITAIDLAHYQTSCGSLPIFFHVTACVQDTTTDKAIVAGYYVNGSGIKQMFVARLVTNGESFDDTVGTCYFPTQTAAPKTGYTVLGYDTLQNPTYEKYDFEPTDIVIDGANNIVVIGVGKDSALSTNPTDIFLARFDANLILDITFNPSDSPPGLLLSPATGLGIAQPSAPAVQIGISPANLYVDSTASTYLFLVQTTNHVESGIVSLNSADGSFNTSFNNLGYNIFSNTDFGGQATDYFSFNAFTKGTDSASNQNYYLVGGVAFNGLVVAVTTAGVLQTTGTFGLATGFASFTSAQVGQSAGQDLEFFGIVQISAATHFYIAGECGENIIVIYLLQNGTGLNTGFNNSGALFGTTPGVAALPASLLGGFNKPSLYNFYRDSTNNIYMSGIVGTQIFLASIAANGNNFNTAFGDAGATIFNKSDFGFNNSDTLDMVMWKPKLPFNPAVTSFFLVTNTNSYRSNTASFVQLSPQATEINPGYGDGGSTYEIFAQVFYYSQHLVLDVQDVNIHVTSLETPVGQCLQLLEETDNPLSPLVDRSLRLPQLVLNITDAFFDGDKIVVVATEFAVDNTGAVLQPCGFIARFTSNYGIDTTFNAADTPGYKEYLGSVFGGVDTDPVIFMAGIQDETDGNYFVGGSIKVAPEVFYRALLTKVQNDGSTLVTTFNSPLGYKTYYPASFGGTSGTNSVFTALFQSPVGTSTENQLYVLATTNIYILAATDIVPFFYPISEDGNVTVNGGDLAAFTQIDRTSGAFTGTMATIDASIFVFFPGADVPDIQPIDILQIPYALLPDGTPEENYFYVGLNLIGAEFHSAVISNYGAILKYEPDLSGLVDGYGYNRDTGARGFGITLFDSEDFGIPISAQSLVAGTTLALLNNENVLFAGYACIDDTATDPLFQTLIIQMQADGVPNQRFNTTGYRLGGTAANELGYMTSFAGGVAAASGFDGGVFVFGQGVSSALKNVIEAALRRRYGL
jgi:hypothetical protein